MSTPPRITRPLVATFALFLAACATFPAPADSPSAAATTGTSYTPSRGQSGKDVMWIPTPDRLVSRMLQMAQVTPQDYVVDLGSGDGKIVLAAASTFSARALGLEYNADMVALSQRTAQQAGLAGRAQFRRADIFTTDFSDATVVTMYLLPQLNLQLRKTLLAMKPGTRLVSHQWTMGNWEADETSWLNATPLYLWLVPANAGGTWELTYPEGSAAQGRVPVSTSLSMTQQFQRLTEARVDVAGIRSSLRAARLDGDRLRFGFTDGRGVFRQFDGRITGARISGQVSDPDGSTAEFSARRSGITPAIGGSQGYSEEESARTGAELGG